MPTSILSYLPSNIPKSLGDVLPGIPQAAGDILRSGLGSIASPGGVLSGFLGGGFGGRNDSVNNTETDLTKFLQDIKTHGVAFNNRFDVRFTPPSIIQETINKYGNKGGPSSFDNEHLTMRIDMAELPGMTYVVSEHRANPGPMMKAPIGVAYTDLTLNFIVSASLVEKYFFDYWNYAIRDSSGLFAYPQEMFTDIFVNVYAMNGQEIYGVKFMDAWPIAVNPIQLSWQDSDNMRLSVTFAYTRWEPVPKAMLRTTTNAVSGIPNGSGNFFADFALGVLPSIPGAGKVLGYLNQSPQGLVRAGVSMIGNRVQPKDPISGAVVSVGFDTISKYLGGR
jgi:hypothetical protein